MRLSLLVIALVSIVTFSFAQQDTIPNPGFENWIFNPQYDEPEDWNTLNPLAAILGAELAFKAENAGEFHSGAAGIKLVTTNINGIGVTPSVLTNGVINTATQNIEGGQPINSRPMSLGGWFRFDPVNSDTGFFEIRLLRWNTLTGSRETVGTANMDVSNTNGVFVNLDAEVSYASSETPDTVLILMGSGGTAPQEGSTMYVDDLYYTYPAGIAGHESVSLNVYPNPATDFLNIDAIDGHRFSTGAVYSATGKLMFNFDPKTRTIDVSELLAGHYIVELSSNQGVVARQQFLKN